MWIFPDWYSDKTTLVDWDKTMWYDSEGVWNKNFSLLSVFNYIIGKITTSNVNEWTNLYYTDARFDTRLWTKTTDNLTEWTTNKYASTTNVDAAWAVMNTDTSTASMNFVIDEDDMSSNSATKVPTQQSVKAYTDSKLPKVLYSENIWSTVDDTDYTITHNLWVTEADVEAWKYWIMLTWTDSTGYSVMMIQQFWNSYLPYKNYFWTTASVSDVPWTTNSFKIRYNTPATLDNTRIHILQNW